MFSSHKWTICPFLIDVIKGTLNGYSQTSIEAPPLGVSLAGCYTQVAVLSRSSQSSCHVENILTVTRKILSKEGLPVCAS